ncbi:hypothetical protein V7T10_07300, partial [Segatella copri]
KALSMSDFIKIRDVELPEDKPRLSVSRDLFLFACYAGTAFIDSVSITKANVKVLEDGDKWLVYNRKKTGTLARVKLLPEALEDDEKYGGKKPYRTYLGPQYLGGYSDHLPLLVQFAF